MSTTRSITFRTSPAVARAGLPANPCALSTIRRASTAEISAAVPVLEPFDVAALEVAAFVVAASGVARFDVAAFEDAAFDVPAFGNAAFDVPAFGNAAFDVAAFGDAAFGVAAFGDAAFEAAASPGTFARLTGAATPPSCHGGAAARPATRARFGAGEIGAMVVRVSA